MSYYIIFRNKKVCVCDVKSGEIVIRFDTKPKVELDVKVIFVGRTKVEIKGNITTLFTDEIRFSIDYTKWTFHEQYKTDNIGSCEYLKRLLDTCLCCNGTKYIEVTEEEISGGGQGVSYRKVEKHCPEC